MPSLRKTTIHSSTGARQFFLINLCHEELINYYKMNFALLQYHKYSLNDIEDMIPFERDVYVTLLIQYLEEEKQRQKEQANR